MNLFGKTVVSMAVLLAFGGADAAQNGRVSMMTGATSSRMPVMPVVSLNTIGNPAVQTVGGSGNTGSGLPTPHIDPQNPDNPDTPSGCEDGGVRNSKYTIAMCMDDLLQCVNNGGLQGGINGLFNSDVRNSIMTGMRLCQTVVDKCVAEVRVNCRNIYNETPDVWLDFNSRVIQPEYYNFVLRKTGLTPNQAENTCLLLDRNTYGESFAAVSDHDVVNTEYNELVGAYNEALDGKLSKDNPQGEDVNTDGYDGNRGHYARWDASTAECLVRVAAYNKDDLITTKWWFGGDDDIKAEVWQKAGSSFTCNKELFDFKSLMNKTREAAVVAIPGGAVLGAVIGASAGAATAKKQGASGTDASCKSASYRKELGQKIKSSRNIYTVQAYFEKQGTSAKAGKAIFDKDTDWNKLTEGECQGVFDLQQRLKYYKTQIAKCKDARYSKVSAAVRQCANAEGVKTIENITYDATSGITIYSTNTVTCTGISGLDGGIVQEYSDECRFVPLYSNNGDIAHCSKGDYGCLELSKIEQQVQDLEAVFGEIGFGKTQEVDKAAQIGKGTAIGAATGAGAGAIATAITALVERSHITCKVGDGLNTVMLGKSHTIDSLKDFYVKWNLTLPDHVSPTAVVTDWESWQQACSQFNSRLMECPKVTINLKTKGSHNMDVYTEVSDACHKVGTLCVGREGIMKSRLYGETILQIPLPVATGE